MGARRRRQRSLLQNDGAKGQACARARVLFMPVTLSPRAVLSRERIPRFRRGVTRVNAPSVSFRVYARARYCRLTPVSQSPPRGSFDIRENCVALSPRS